MGGGVQYFQLRTSSSPGEVCGRSRGGHLAPRPSDPARAPPARAAWSMRPPPILPPVNPPLRRHCMAAMPTSPSMGLSRPLPGGHLPVLGWEGRPAPPAAAAPLPKKKEKKDMLRPRTWAQEPGRGLLPPAVSQPLPATVPLHLSTATCPCSHPPSQVLCTLRGTTSGGTGRTTIGSLYVLHCW